MRPYVGTVIMNELQASRDLIFVKLDARHIVLKPDAPCGFAMSAREPGKAHNPNYWSSDLQTSLQQCVQWTPSWQQGSHTVKVAIDPSHFVDASQGTIGALGYWSDTLKKYDVKQDSNDNRKAHEARLMPPPAPPSLSYRRLSR